MRSSRSAQGFTLIEVIVIVVVAGLLAALVVQLTGSQLLRASNPATVASDAGEAEAAMEGVVAYYTAVSNNSTSGVLADVTSHYSGNSTVSIQSITFSGVPALQVTTTVGNTAYTTLLTQARTSLADTPAGF